MYQLMDVMRILMDSPQRERAIIKENNILTKNQQHAPVIVSFIPDHEWSGKSGV